MSTDYKGRLAKKLDSSRGTGVAYNDYEHRADSLFPTNTQMAKSAELNKGGGSTLPKPNKIKRGGFDTGLPKELKSSSHKEQMHIFRQSLIEYAKTNNFEKLMKISYRLCPLDLPKNYRIRCVKQAFIRAER